MKNDDQEPVVSLNAEILKDVVVQVDVVDRKVPTSYCNRPQRCNHCQFLLKICENMLTWL